MFGRRTPPTVPEPLPKTDPAPPEDFKRRSFALYCDGTRANTDGPPAILVDDDGIGITVSFRTSLNALTGVGDPVQEKAWGGYSQGDDVHLRQPHAIQGKKYPSSGYGIVEGIIVPARADETVMFRIRPVTPIIDWEAQDSIPEQGDGTVLVPASWLPRKGF